MNLSFQTEMIKLDTIKNELINCQTVKIVGQMVMMKVKQETDKKGLSAKADNPF